MNLHPGPIRAPRSRPTFCTFAAQRIDTLHPAPYHAIAQGALSVNDFAAQGNMVSGLVGGTGALRAVRTDQDIANDLKRRLAEAYKPVLDVLDEAHSAGFIVSVQTGLGPFDKQAILSLQVLKKF